MIPALERFEAKVELAGPDDCWNWLACVDKCGYGRFRFSPQKNGFAHRFAYESYVGPIPEGLEPDHLCRNPACVNPAHLEMVTHQENTARGMAPEILKAFAFQPQTHCKRGHLFDEENTHIRPNGNKTCRTCRNAAQRVRRRYGGGGGASS